MGEPREVWKRYIQRCERLGGKPARDLLVVSLAAQRLRHLREEGLVAEYVCSTSRKPPSCVDGSGGTPTGWHRVAEKHGDGQPPGMILRGRQPTGMIWHEQQPGSGDDGNFVTTRILWLAGEEPGHNAGPGCDSYARYIYIHGTNHPERIGQPASGGCVLLRDDEMVTLFDAVEPGAAVWIG